MNAYINTREHTHHLAFKLAGITPDPWTIEDSLTIMDYMGWDSAGNLQAGIISQMLVDKLGLDKAREIFPVTNNPDDIPGAESEARTRGATPPVLNLALDRKIRNYLGTGTLRVGPLMVEALMPHEETRELGRILAAWDFRDDTDQIPYFISGEKLAWWFSDKAIKVNAESTLTLTPF